MIRCCMYLHPARTSQVSKSRRRAWYRLCIQPSPCANLCDPSIPSISCIHNNSSRTRNRFFRFLRTSCPAPARNRYPGTLSATEVIRQETAVFDFHELRSSIIETNEVTPAAAAHFPSQGRPLFQHLFSAPSAVPLSRTS